MMTWFREEVASAVNEFRWNRKCHGCLFFACAALLIMMPANARPQLDDTLVPPQEGLPLSDEYSDADNIEFHQAKVVDGMLHEEHPIIMYKEDFVSEDFEPKKKSAHHTARKHKDPDHRRRRIGAHDGSEQYHPLQPEKIYFDILSPAPIVASDELSKANPLKVHVEVISLADGEAHRSAEDADLKYTLSKRPKKYHHRRQRRDTENTSHGDHFVRKRNPYYRVSKLPNNANGIGGSAPFANYYLPTYPSAKHFQKHAIAGEYFNGPANVRPIALGVRFGGPGNTDRVIWRDYTPTRNPNQRLNITRGTPAPLFPQRMPAVAQSAVTRTPADRPTTEQSLAGAGSFPDTIITEAPSFQYPTAAPVIPPASTTCVWAIASCCSAADRNVRYRCFERYGCYLVFWNLNPCADEIRDNIVDYLDKQFE